MHTCMRFEHMGAYVAQHRIAPTQTMGPEKEQHQTTGILNYPIKVNCNSFAICVSVLCVCASHALAVGHSNTPQTIYNVATGNLQLVPFNRLLTIHSNE